MNILFLGAYENNGRRYENEGNDSSIGDTGDTASPLIAPLFSFSFFLLRVQLQHALSTSRLASSREL